MSIRDLVDETAFSEAEEELLAILLEEEGINLPQADIIKPRQEEEAPLLSFAQQRLWFLEQLIPGSSSYNMPVAYRLTGSLNLTALEQSLGEILRRHSVLRTTFPTMDGQPSQVLASDMTFTLPVIDLRELSETQKQAEAQTQATEHAQQPFDLAQGPLWRVKLLCLSEAEHVLLLTIHHMVADGWSFNVFLQELAALYQAFATDQPSPLPELPIQYADFAQWQHEWLQDGVLESQLDYWKQQLGSNLPILHLPTDYPRPPIQTYQGAYQSLELSLELTKALKVLSQQQEVTLFMTLLAAFQAFLYRYTGQENIIVGSPIAGRTRMETEGLIGLFLNTLALHTDLSGNPSFRELLGRVREMALEAYAHQDLPFEKLIEALQPERDLSRSPLFQVMFVLQNEPRQTWEGSGLTLTPLEVHNGTAKFDLTLELHETSAGLKGRLEYNTDLFNAATIARMVRHLQTLLEGIVAHPEQRLSDLPLLTQAERHQLLVEWNDTQVDYPKDACIHQLFEAQVEKTPDAVAVVFVDAQSAASRRVDEQLTYRELNCRANQLAHYLQNLGVGPEMLVGICVRRSIEMVVGLLGIIKAGGAYVPLDPEYPQERLAFMLEDAQVSVLLTQQRLVDSLPESRAKVICLDRDWEAIAAKSEEKLASWVTPDHLAYVIYTSGSTGQPKGVQISHRPVVNFLSSMHLTPGLHKQDTLLSVTTLSFDIAVLELFLPLTVGARVMLVSREVATDGAHLLARLKDSGATAMQATPATWRLLLEAGWQGSSQLKLLCGGEALSRKLANDLLERGAALWNLYGPTEATIWSIIHPVEDQDGPVPIGRPIANTQVYVLDRHLQPVPIGVPGELHIGGDGLARGYLNQSKLTAERFIPNPFSTEPGTRLYKTGDLARYRSDGNIEFLGRLDHQVKIRGYRIELGEVEAVLAQHPAVQETVVVAREDVPSDVRLVSYVVLNQEQVSSSGELQGFLRDKLPYYMVPSAFVFLGALPLMSNGKVDKQALPAPEQVYLAPDRNFAAPQTALELELAKIWKKVLNLQTIGVRDNFFDLGGHSLLAARLLAQIEQVFGKKLPLASLFQAQTVEQLAELLRHEGWSAPHSSLIAIQPSGTKQPFFCVHDGYGSVLCYAHLAHHLGLNQPFYGLQPLRFDEEQTPLTQIEAMAAHYIDQMRSIQPEGPYLLGGLCVGGLIAFEMAQQLHRQGEEVALLALMNVSLPESINFLHYRRPTPLSHWISHLPIHLRNLLQLILSRQLTRAFKEAKKITKILVKQVLIPSLFNASETDYRTQVRKANQQALQSYIPLPYPDRITLFLGGGISDREMYAIQQGWSTLAIGEQDTHVISGNSDVYAGAGNILHEPCVQDLAKKLRACLDTGCDYKQELGG